MTSNETSTVGNVNILVELGRRGNLSGLTAAELLAVKPSLPLIRQDLLSGRQSVASFPLRLDELVGLLEQVAQIAYEEQEMAEICKDLCLVVEAYIEQVSADDVVASYQPLLYKGLRSMVTDIQMLSLKQIARIAETDTVSYVPVLLGESSDFVEASLSGLMSSEDGAARLLLIMQRLFAQMSKVDEGKLMCSQHVQRCITSAFEQASSVAQTRIIDLLSACCNSERFCQVYHDNGVLSSLNNWMRDDEDPLLRVTTLELLGRFADNQFGFEYLMSHGIIDEIAEIMSRAVDQMTNDEGSGMLELVVTQCVAFLGRLGMGSPEKVFQLDERFHLIRHVIRFLSANDPQLNEAAVTTIGRIISSPKGINFMGHKFPRIWRMLASEFVSKSTSPLQSLRLALLRALAAFFAAADLESHHIVVSMFDLIGREYLLTVCSKAAQNSFSDWKNAGYACLHGIACHIEGCQTFLRDSILVTQFLLNRTSEHSHEGHVSKYNLNNQIVNTCRLNNVNTLSPGEQHQLQKIQEYVSKGVYYQKSETFVAMGGAE